MKTQKINSLRGLTDHHDFLHLHYCLSGLYRQYSSRTAFRSRISRYHTVPGQPEGRTRSYRTGRSIARFPNRFFTMYVLHKPWDPTQVPMRRFDTYLPYVPSQDETRRFISTTMDIKQKAMVALMFRHGLRIGEVCRLRYGVSGACRTCESISRMARTKTDGTPLLSSAALDILHAVLVRLWKTHRMALPKQTDPSVQRHLLPVAAYPGATKKSFRIAKEAHLPFIPPRFWYASPPGGTDCHDNKDLMGHNPDLWLPFVSCLAVRTMSSVSALLTTGAFTDGGL